MKEVLKTKKILNEYFEKFFDLNNSDSLENKTKEEVAAYYFILQIIQTMEKYLTVLYQIVYGNKFKKEEIKSLLKEINDFIKQDIKPNWEIIKKTI